MVPPSLSDVQSPCLTNKRLEALVKEERNVDCVTGTSQ